MVTFLPTYETVITFADYVFIVSWLVTFSTYSIALWVMLSELISMTLCAVVKTCCVSPRMPSTHYLHLGNQTTTKKMVQEENQNLHTNIYQDINEVTKEWTSHLGRLREGMPKNGYRMQGKILQLNTRVQTNYENMHHFTLWLRTSCTGSKNKNKDNNKRKKSRV